jgi:hypothetical protein
LLFLSNPIPEIPLKKAILGILFFLQFLRWPFIFSPLVCNYVHFSVLFSHRARNSMWMNNICICLKSFFFEFFSVFETRRKHEIYRGSILLIRFIKSSEPITVQFISLSHESFRRLHCSKTGRVCCNVWAYLPVFRSSFSTLVYRSLHSPKHKSFGQLLIQ